MEAGGLPSFGALCANLLLRSRCAGVREYDRASLDFLRGAQVRQLKGTIGLVCIVKLVGEGIERPVPIARVLLEGVSV